MKTMKLACLAGILAAMWQTSPASCTEKEHPQLPLYKQAGVPLEQRVEDLLGRMTLEEKVYQVNQYTLGLNDNANNIGEVKNVPAEIGSVIYFGTDAKLRNELQRRAMEDSRLGIPILFGFDVIHGFRTIYPIPLAQSCSWNPALTGQACEVAAKEARASGIDWTFSPMIDVARDPRWGRVAEGYGEDPYATAVYATAAVKGYQGNDLREPAHVAACLKHFAGYGASEAGRDYVYTEISRPTLWNTYLIPYEAGIKAGAATVMSSFNDINGTPATAHTYLLTEVLKEKWGHDGFVVSDWTAVVQLINQGVAADRREAAGKAFAAGVDMDMIDNCYKDFLPELVETGKIPYKRLDDAVRRILRLKFSLGLFEAPYTPTVERASRFLLPPYRAIAEQLAEESMVLLKNDKSLLPLESHGRIALVGPMAKNRDNMLGSWHAKGEASDACSIYDAMVQEFKGKGEILYAEGCGFEGEDRSQFAAAAKTAAQADVIVACLGERWQWSGENAPRASISLPAIQEQLLAELEKTGKPVVVVLSNGRPIDLSRIEPLADAIVEMWQPGIPGGRPLAGILSGRVNPSGKLSITFPRSAAQIPIYYNHRPAARKGNLGHYQDMPSTPLYEFAHGLSYTTYDYGELESSADTVAEGGKVTVEIPVTNSGRREGMETVHWYIQDPACSQSRPVKELKFFEKQNIKPGETRIFRFTVDPLRDLSYRDEQGNPVLEEGDYYILVKDRKIKLTVTGDRH